MQEEYLKGAVGRFERAPKPEQESMFEFDSTGITYKLNHPAALWNGHESPLPEDGGKLRRVRARSRA